MLPSKSPYKSACSSSWSQALLGRIEGGALGDGRGLEDAVELEPQIVVQACGGMLLHGEARVLGGPSSAFPAGLAGLLEVAFGAIAGELFLSHRDPTQKQ